MARKHYSEQFKQDAVKLITEQGYSISKASRALGVSHHALSSWKKTLAPREQADVQTENQRLRREIQELRAEREILKKAATFFAKEQR